MPLKRAGQGIARAPSGAAGFSKPSATSVFWDRAGCHLSCERYQGKLIWSCVYHRLPYEEAMEEGKLVAAATHLTKRYSADPDWFLAGEQKGFLGLPASIHDRARAAWFEVAYQGRRSALIRTWLPARVALTKGKKSCVLQALLQGSLLADAAHLLERAGSFARRTGPLFSRVKPACSRTPRQRKLRKGAVGLVALITICGIGAGVPAAIAS